MSTPISRPRAVQKLLKQTLPVTPVMLPPSKAIGSVVSKTVIAVCQVPEHACSVRDGYALRAADIERAAPMNPVRLTVIQSIHAESRNPMPLKSGETARVLTGGPIPDGADTVLAEENVTIEEEAIEVRTPVRTGWFVRPAGGEIAKSTIITKQGQTISPQAAAVMTRTRTGQILVHPRPSVQLFALGSELVDPAIHDDPKRFPADNLVLLRGLFEAGGANVAGAEVLPDNKQALVSMLSEKCLPEIIVTTGGTGRSERDFARTGALESGFTMVFERVDMRPGRNVFAARRDDTVLFGLPGPPAAGHVCFHALILPVLRRLRGLPDQTEPLTARFTQGISARPGFEWLVQCELAVQGASITATPLAGKDVPAMVGLSKANGIAVIGDGQAVLPNEEIEILTTLF